VSEKIDLKNSSAAAAAVAAIRRPEDKSKEAERSGRRMKNTEPKPCRPLRHGIQTFKPEAWLEVDSSKAQTLGRSTQIARLVDWLETGGHPTVQVGLSVPRW